MSAVNQFTVTDIERRHAIEIDDTLTIHDICRIFHVSQGTVYRWIALAKQGRHSLPIPIGDSNRKKKLCWSRESIAAYQNANNPPPVKVESASERSRRHSVACEALAKHGVKINTET
jgi:transposase-like protein